MAGRRQVDAELGAFGREEAMRNLHEHAAAVAELGVGADRAAMVEIDEDLQALLEDVVRLAVAHVGDEADAAGIVLPGGVVEALGARQERVGTTTGPRERRPPAGMRSAAAALPRFARAGERSPGA